MLFTLTSSSLSAIISGDVSSKPLLQVLDIKLLGNSQDRYRLLLSDASMVQYAMLVTSLSGRVTTGQVRIGSIVRLIDYVCSTIQNRKIIVILDMETIIPDCDIIGNPRMVGESDSVAQQRPVSNGGS